jgi:hypothetical protein
MEPARNEGGDVMSNDRTDATGMISHDEAEQILSRFNASHWRDRTTHERARYSIPADPKRDDDIRLGEYIKQSRARDAEHAEMLALLRRLGAWIHETAGEDRVPDEMIVAVEGLLARIDAKDAGRPTVPAGAE